MQALHYRHCEINIAMVLAISDWPDEERPREKLLTRGAAALSDAELVAIFLRTGRNGLTAVDLAREMLTDSQGLRCLFDRINEEKLPGVGPAKRATLLAALELGKRYLETELAAGDVISSPAVTRAYCRAQMRHLPAEAFAVMFLDSRHQVLAFETLFHGTIDGASVHPREVVRRCLSHNAAAVIFTHNHPSGVAEPSRADRAITRQLTEALNLIDVRVIDHLVVGESETVSFAERGLL